MAETVRARIGYLSSTSPQSVGSPAIRALIPSEVHVDFVGLGQDVEPDLVKRHQGTMDSIVERIRGIVDDRQWQGAVVSGAPREVMNPEILPQLQAAVPVPIITAMGASTAALKACRVKRVMCITAMDSFFISNIRQYVQDRGVEAVAAPQLFEQHEDAIKLPPDEVFKVTKEAFEGVGPADAIYFQGSDLRPIPVLQRLEDELGVTVVTSNTSMFWWVLSKLGIRYSIPDHGRLLREWPEIV